jgi:hypothetical protein
MLPSNDILTVSDVALELRCSKTHGHNATKGTEIDGPKILTLAETAAFLRCSKGHVSHAINGGIKDIPLLPHIQIGRRKLIVKASLLAWMEQIERTRV